MSREEIDMGQHLGEPTSRFRPGSIPDLRSNDHPTAARAPPITYALRCLNPQSAIGDTTFGPFNELISSSRNIVVVPWQAVWGNCDPTDRPSAAQAAPLIRSIRPCATREPVGTKARLKTGQQCPPHRLWLRRPEYK